jgi:integrase
MQLATRKSRLRVWVYRWFELDQAGESIRKKKVIGPVSRFSSERKAWAEVERLGLGYSFDQNGPRSLEELADHYTKTELPEEQPEDSRLAFSTKEGHRLYLKNYIVPRWGTTPLCDIKAVAVEEWLKTLCRFNDQTIPLASGTKEKIRDIMHVLFEHAGRYEWTDRNPISYVRQSGKRQATPELISVEDLSTLIFSVLEVRERTMVFLDFGGGLRRGELAGLKWEDIDFSNGTILPKRSIVRQRVGKTKTEASKKAMPLDEYLLDDLVRWRKETPYADDGDYVFASPWKKGKQPYWMESIMKRQISPIALKEGIRIKGWHTLRHTYSTLLKANGNDPKVVQELLRHANFKTTMDGYTQALSPAKKEAHRGVIHLVVPRLVPRGSEGVAN